MLESATEPADSSQAAPEPGAWCARPDAISVGAIIPRTAVEGPGWRFAVWTRGCPMRCAGCCNPELLAFAADAWVALAEVLRQVVSTDDIEGISLLGGEPFAQAQALGALARGAREAGLGVMVFTGYARATLESGRVPHADALLAACDLLVDGPFVQEHASPRRRFIGSDNQRVHFLSERYAWLRDTWPAADLGVEVRMANGQVRVNGDPRSALMQAARGWGAVGGEARPIAVRRAP